MADITIRINTDGAAFEDNFSELADILRLIAMRAQNHPLWFLEDYTPRDSNGHRCGSITVDTETT